jgi:radical SAM superfamily enzyme YgiQ (UPF0313 family)
MSQDILLINTNVIRPPVSPVGLEYLGETLVEAGESVRILDLSFESDWQKALRRELNDEPLIVGMTVRNTDDCSFSSRVSFLPWIREITSKLREFTSANIMLGGVGFSIMPELIIRITGADFGIVGDGEEVTPILINHLTNKDNVSDIPNLIYWHNGNMVQNPREYTKLNYLPIPRRHLFDNKRYEELGAMVGIETKRGCPQQCIFCADPVAKGNHIRLRSPYTVVNELKDLISQGVSWFHLCDSEFNQPIDHAKQVCQAIIENKLEKQIRWYCYCSPIPFDKELAQLMKHAGCYGINFGVDSLSDEQLSRLGRNHSTREITSLVNLLSKEGFNYIFDLLVGGPGETEETLAATIKRTKELDIPLVGIAAGIRIYPGTTFSKNLANVSIREGVVPLHSKITDLGKPVFYLSPHLNHSVSELINELIDNDPRFLFLGKPSQDGSYNYANDDKLCRVIEAGSRGAYWDIIQRQRESW